MNDYFKYLEKEHNRFKSQKDEYIFFGDNIDEEHKLYVDNGKINQNQKN